MESESGFSCRHFAKKRFRMESEWNPNEPETIQNIVVFMGNGIRTKPKEFKTQQFLIKTESERSQDNS